jgi:hypothetical protein
MRRSLLVSGLALLCLAATPAAAQVTISQSPSTSRVIGTVMRGSAATTFSVSTAGVVTRVSGDAIRVSSSSVTVPTITLNCASNNCKGDEFRVTVTASGASGDSRITRFRFGTLSAGQLRSARPADGASLTFDMRMTHRQNPASFTLGMDVLLEGAANGGTHNFTFTVTATER